MGFIPTQNFFDEISSEIKFANTRHTKARPANTNTL